MDDEMRERPRDDTTETDAGSRRGRGGFDYYYDDGTGYEVFEAEEDEGAGAEEEKDGRVGSKTGCPRPPSNSVE